MKIFRTVQSWKRWRKAQPLDLRLGFVPTMGALHEGHLSLVRASQRSCQKTVVSIFVNPTQFAAHEDLGSYPRTESSDLKKLRDLKVDAVFIPRDGKELYGKDPSFRVQPRAGLVQMMEGKSRPQFFSGVATVVLKLFHLIRPTEAFFGEKDYQQLKVIESVVEDCFLPIKIKAVTTKRERSGLAMSSRNAYFSEDQKARASQLYQILQQARSFSQARRELEKTGFKLEYLECWNNSLTKSYSDWRGRCFVAARFHGVRLIDNFSIRLSKTKR